MNAGSRGLVDPELLDLLDALPSPAMTVETLDHFRGTAAPSYLDPGAMPATNVSRRRIKGSASAPEIALEVYEPVNFHEGGGCILYLHGGGFVGGRSSAVEPRHCELTADLGCMLVAVDYRLAPETTFPGNLEDCYAALAWLHEQADVLKIDRNRI